MMIRFSFIQRQLLVLVLVVALALARLAALPVANRLSTNLCKSPPVCALFLGANLANATSTAAIVIPGTTCTVCCWKQSTTDQSTPTTTNQSAKCLHHHSPSNIEYCNYLTCATHSSSQVKSEDVILFDCIALVIIFSHRIASHTITCRIVLSYI